MRTITVNKLGILDSEMLAHFILSKVGYASHLKVQKLLYYVSGFHLAYFDKKIIKDKFEAWVHGPVSKRLYRSLKSVSVLHSDMRFTGDKKEIEKTIKSLITSDQYSLIIEVIRVYGKYSGLELESLTHSEKPWIEARIGYGVGESCSVEIKEESIKELFKEKINV